MELAWSFPRAPLMVLGLITLVGAKYVGCNCTGLARALSVDSSGCMSIPRNLVSCGSVDPGSILAVSSVTSVAGALGPPAWFHEESDVLGEFMYDSSCTRMLCFTSFGAPLPWCHSSICQWNNESSYQTNTLPAKQDNWAVTVDLSQTKKCKQINQMQANKCKYPIALELTYKLPLWTLIWSTNCNKEFA